MAEEVSAVLTEVKTSDEEQIVEKNKIDTMVSDLAQDYSKYLKVNIATEKAALEDEIEDVLTRLDEFTSLVDMVRGDNALCLNSTLPEIFKKCEEMEKMFDKVDKLEAKIEELKKKYPASKQMVQRIKQNLDVMEEKVAEAEEKLDSSSVKKLFNTLQKPLFSKKNSESKKQLKYEPPEIFKTEDYFPNQDKSSVSDEKNEET